MKFKKMNIHILFQHCTIENLSENVADFPVTVFFFNMLDSEMWNKDILHSSRQYVDLNTLTTRVPYVEIPVNNLVLTILN